MGAAKGEIDGSIKLASFILFNSFNIASLTPCEEQGIHNFMGVGSLRQIL